MVLIAEDNETNQKVIVQQLALGELCAELEAAGKAAQSAALPGLWLRFTVEMAAVDAALAELTAPRDTPDREAPT